MKISRLYPACIFLAWQMAVSGQYAPGAGIAGTDAINCDSSAIKAWANKCWVKRGPQQSGNQDMGLASSGNNSDCLGKADNIAVSLGDGGEAVVKFSEIVKDISGNDFAVFENSFDGRFLELAYVEVSSDSIRWIRFPSISLTQTTVQTGTFDILNPEKIDNLAGKYQALYGTPFDLYDIRDSSGIDFNNIRFIRITDVVGSVSDQLARFDSKHNRINDPWPTPFPQSGFDLDAVAILRSVKNHIDQEKESTVVIYPNPAVTKVYVRFSIASDRIVSIFNSTGSLVMEIISDGQACELDVSFLSKGLYIIKIKDHLSQTLRKLIIG
jgi:hypothetical protein